MRTLSRKLWKRRYRAFNASAGLTHGGGIKATAYENLKVGFNLLLNR